MTKRPLMIAAAVALVAIGGYLFMDRASEDTAAVGSTLVANAATPEVLVQAADDTEEAIDLSRVVEMSEGNPDAAVTIIEFSSFTCPHCARYNASVFPQIRETYIDTGLINYIKREVYFDAYGLWGALVARCGGVMSYSGISEMIYAEQSEWARAGEANAVADALRSIGRRAGLDNEQLNACLTDREMAVALMETYRQGVEDYGINSTPSFVINGENHPNMSFAEFQAIIDPLLVDAE